MKSFEADEFSLERVEKMKGAKRLFVVFSTFGEREADLIFEKIGLLGKECSSIIDEIIVSHRRADAALPERTEQMVKDASEEAKIVLCNTYTVPDMGDEKGKGADMRRTLYFIRKELGASDDDVVLYLDADVVTEYFGKHFVIALAGAVFAGNAFAKASFWRAMGRVKKYVAQPLFSAIDHPQLQELRSLAYPLSGEVAGTVGFFSRVKFWQMYGVETGINVDAVVGAHSVADVNLGLYDHEHSSDISIQKMAFGIIRTYLKKLEEYGFIEFKKGATVSDIFQASFVGENGERQYIDAPLSEKVYEPLKVLF